MDNKPKEIVLEPDTGVFICRLRRPLRHSHFATHSGQMAENTGMYMHDQTEVFIECKMLDVTTGLLTTTEKMVTEGCLHMRSFQWHLKEH